jgi:hypothetical protein
MLVLAKSEAKNEVVCNYTPFCFTAMIDGELVGAIAGATCFSEVYIDESVAISNMPLINL